MPLIQTPLKFKNILHDFGKQQTPFPILIWFHQQ